MRALARQCFDNPQDAGDILTNWYESEAFERLRVILADTALPEPALAISYALSNAHDLLNAAYFIHMNRVNRRVDFSHLDQTPADIAADLRFVNMR